MSPVPEDDKNRDEPEKGEHNVENLEMPQYTLNIGTSSDSEDDDGGNNGYYQLLPQDPSQSIPYPIPDDDADENDDYPTPTIENPPGNIVDYSYSASGAETLDTEQSSVESSIDSSAPSYMQVPKCKSGDSQDRSELWNTPQVGKLGMDPDQADQIKKALSGFSLPPPPWARVVPEQQWKTRLISSLGQPIQQDNPWQGKRGPCEKSKLKDQPENCDISAGDTCSSGWATFSDSQSNQS